MNNVFPGLSDDIPLFIHRFAVFMNHFDGFMNHFAIIIDNKTKS